MSNSIIVSYKYSDTSINNDLVCDLTTFMDSYLNIELTKDWSKSWYKTYLYNDLSLGGKELNIGGNYSSLGGNIYRLTLRVPGSTRGGLILSRLDYNRFEILDIVLIEETCFGKFGCYDTELKNTIKNYIGKILDFSNVQLINNRKLYEL